MQPPQTSAASGSQARILPASHHDGSHHDREHSSQTEARQQTLKLEAVERKLFLCEEEIKVLKSENSSLKGKASWKVCNLKCQ